MHSHSKEEISRSALLGPLEVVACCQIEDEDLELLSAVRDAIEDRQRAETGHSLIQLAGLILAGAPRMPTPQALARKLSKRAVELLSVDGITERTRCIGELMQRFSVCVEMALAETERERGEKRWGRFVEALFRQLETTMDDDEPTTEAVLEAIESVRAFNGSTDEEQDGADRGEASWAKPLLDAVNLARPFPAIPPVMIHAGIRADNSVGQAASALVLALLAVAMDSCSGPG